jgi:hypothetical protein
MNDKLDYFPIGNKIAMGNFVQDAKMFLVRGDECVEISYGDFGYTDLQKIEVVSRVRSVLGDYEYEEGHKYPFDTSIPILPPAAEILIISGVSYLAMYRGGYLYYGTCPTRIAREWASAVWRVER